MPFICYGTITNYDPRPSVVSGITFTTINGTQTTDSGFTVVSFTNTAGGSLTVTSITGTLTVYYLAVGGGGAGGGDAAGGGGGGAVTYGKFTLSSATTINITVGSGYTTPASGVAGTKGGDTTISGTAITTITAGGGAGGSYYLSPNNPATSITNAFGGSGGGAGLNGTSGTTVTPNPNTFFNLGGTGASNGCGGGGGAGSVGVNATTGPAGSGGAGGSGKLYSSFSTDTSNYNASINNVLALLPGYGSGSAAGYLGAGGGGGYNGAGGSNGAGGPGGYSTSSRGKAATVYGGGSGGSHGGGAAGSDSSYQGVVLLSFLNGYQQLPVTTLTTDVTSNLIWWYRLQSGDITSTSLYNAVTKTSDATVFGSPTFSTTIYKTGNSSLTLSNSGLSVTQYIQFPSFNFTGSTYTVTWWAKFTATTWSNTMIFSDTTVNAYTSGYFEQINDNNSKITPFSPNYTSNLRDNNWHLFVMQINSGTNSTRGIISVDGAALGTTYITNDLGWKVNLNCLYNYYGFSSWDGSQMTNGNVSDIRLYNGALLTPQIQALYNIGASTAILTSYSVSASGNTITITWTGTGINNIILTNNTTGTSYGPITTSGTTYNLSYTVTNNFYITPFDSSSRAGLATKLFTIPV